MARPGVAFYPLHGMYY